MKPLRADDPDVGHLAESMMRRGGGLALAVPATARSSGDADQRLDLGGRARVQWLPDDRVVATVSSPRMGLATRFEASVEPDPADRGSVVLRGTARNGTHLLYAVAFLPVLLAAAAFSVVAATEGSWGACAVTAVVAVMAALAWWSLGRRSATAGLRAAHLLDLAFVLWGRGGAEVDARP